ncbi:hypothetical protein, partial [Pseudomonas spelaei]|uniref:hypothetical protein n=1 Tax=Pseudomonas spelaei TaxID=1055469 RepID=UPI001C49A3D3
MGKNIKVTSGQPMGPSSSGPGTITIGGRSTPSRSGWGPDFSVSYARDGIPKGHGGNGAGNVNVMMSEMIEEALLSGQGWPSIDVYRDLGIDAWNLLPLQIE